MDQVQGVLALALRAMHQDMARVDRVSNNLANAMTPGFKREVAMTAPFAAMVSQLQSAAADASPVVSIQTDVRPGSLKSTGQKLDFAIDGAGYFEVMTEAGPAYTRQGNFHVDAQGRLVTVQGYPVMGLGGEINLGTATPSVDEAGRLRNGAQAKGVPGALLDAPVLAQLKLVALSDHQALQRLGDGLLAGGGTATPMAEGATRVRQGYLENSNVSSMHEMVQLMQTMRHFESMHKVAMGYDEMVGLAVRKLGELA